MKQTRSFEDGLGNTIPESGRPGRVLMVVGGTACCRLLRKLACLGVPSTALVAVAGLLVRRAQDMDTSPSRITSSVSGVIQSQAKART